MASLNMVKYKPLITTNKTLYHTTITKYINLKENLIDAFREFKKLKSMRVYKAYKE